MRLPKIETITSFLLIRRHTRYLSDLKNESDQSVSYELDDRPRKRSASFESENRVFFSKVPRQGSEPNQSSIQWLQRGLYPNLKSSVYEIHHSRPSTTDVKNAWSYTFIAFYVSTAWYLNYTKTVLAFFMF